MDSSLKLVMFLYILTCVSVGLDITLLRQIFGFIYLSFIPGYLFLKILKLGEIDRIETVTFSVGLSIAFLMFLGLLLNETSLTFNLSRPLSTIPLMVTVSGLTLILFLPSYRRKDKEAKSLSSEKANVATILQICSLSVLPAFSIVGALYHNTSVLLLMILGVAVLCAASIFSGRLIPAKIFPLAIASASIALLLHTVLVSKHLMGSDVFSEFYGFKLTEIRGYWHAPGPVLSYSLTDALSSILSITILPTIYTTILRIDGEIFFKLFYPLIFSLIPLALYKMYEQQTGRKVALLSVLFFISTPVVFYGGEPLSLNRQIIGQLFFILSMLLIVEKKLDLWKKRVLLVVFGTALTLSHYSVAYIFIFYIIAIFVFSRIPIFSYRKVTILSLGLTLLLIALTFSWYIYVSDSPLNQLLHSFRRIVSWFGADLFRSEARVQPALRSLSPTTTTTLIGTIHKGLIYLEHFFIGIGIIVLTIKPKKFRLDSEFRLAAIVSMAILLLCFGIPNFAPMLNMTRFYSIIVPFLAPFFVLGGTFLLRLIGKFVAPLLSKLGKVGVKNLGLYIVTCVLIASFLFQVGFVNHVTGGYPSSFSLDLDRREKSSDLSIRVTTHSRYFLDQEVFSARWLQENVNPTSKVYADWNSRFTVLRSYALLPNDRILQITNDTTLESRTYIYLKYVNIRVGVISTASSGFFNTSDISPILANCNKIYSNGYSDIYHVP